MLIHLVVLLLFGCITPDDTPSSLAVAPIQKLSTMAAQIDLPPQNHPLTYSTEERFVLPATQGKNAGTQFVTLPFHVPPDGKRYKPTSMTVMANGEKLDFRTANTKKNSWIVDGNRLSIYTSKEVDEVEVHYPALSEMLKKNSFQHAGLPEEQFVQRSLTLGTETHNGLLLPAPSTISWRATIPSSGQFQATTAIMPAQFTASRSDGVTFILSIETQTGSDVVDTVQIPTETTQFSDWNVDLSAYQGQTVTLRITSDPLENNLWDYAFLGAPTIKSKRRQAHLPRHVIVVGLDTTRPDRFGVMGYAQETSPTLDVQLQKFAIADNAWTPAPRTRPSFRSATTGRQPLEAVGATNIGEVFHEHQFATAGIVSNLHLHPRFDFHNGFDQWHLDASSKSANQVDMALKWLKQNKNNDAYLFLHIMDPHLFYVAPKSYQRRFVQERDSTLPKTFTRQMVYQWLKTRDLSEQRKAHINGLYDAEIAYTADQVTRFLDAVDSMQTETLIVIHSDHGEELFEHGAFEHNHSLIDETTKAVLWIRAPHKQGNRFNQPVTLADIAPTLFDYMGFENTPISDGVSMRSLIDGADPSVSWLNRPIPLGHLQYGHQRWGVVLENHKYILHTRSGQEELYDLNSPKGEHENIAQKRDLSQYREGLAKAHKIRVGAGMHLDFSLKNSEPLTVTLEGAVTEVTVLPYDAVSDHPVNQAWGQQPPYTTPDIASVALSTDRKSFTITPGSHGVGTIAITIPTTTAVTFTVNQDEKNTRSKVSPNKKRATWRQKNHHLTLRKSIVVHPPENEFTRIHALRKLNSTEAATPSEIDLLKTLGYITDDED